MKTSIKTLTTICTVIISLSAIAQRSHNGQNTVPATQNQPAQNNSQTDKRGWASNGNSSSNWGGSVNIHVGGFPNNYNNYGYYPNNYASIKKAARYSISQSAGIIGQAMSFSDWNDTYSPWLAKAIRHQQYAKQLYFWGDYAGALNHAERAGFLAWNTLSYFNGYNGGYNSGYPNPYSDPNNPYYRQGNTNTGTSDDSGYRKNQSGNTNGSAERKQTQPEQKMAKTELDNSLPQSKTSDRELLKMNVKDLDIN